MVYLKDSRFRYILVNQAMEELLGMNLQDIIGKDDFQLMPPETADYFRENDTRVVQTKSTVVVEERLHYKIYESTKFPVLLENGDVVIGGISRDITERKQAENKLKETEERYNALFEQSIDLVFVVGFDGQFLDANSAALDLVGYTRD